MPERRVRLLASAAACVLAGVVAAPAALAQSDEVPPPTTPTWEERWEESAFDFPFDVAGHTIRDQPFRVNGTMRYQKTSPADRIAQVEVRVVDDPSDDRRPPDGCDLPAPVLVPGTTPQPDLQAELAFSAEDLVVECNGRYVVEAEAWLDDPQAPSYTLRQPFSVGMVPPAVDGLDLALDQAARTVTATFTALPDDALGDDFVGYVLERSGPTSDGASSDRFVDVSRVRPGEQPRIVDDLARAAGGTYTYRVRAARAGGGAGEERSRPEDTAVATVTIGEPPGGSAPGSGAVTRRSAPRRGNVSVPRRSSSTSRSTTVTTIDTGYDDEIDYGARPPGSFPDLQGDEPLAGQSIIRDEGDGLDLAAPVAGALVLLGWAGHIAYLNRLAKQL